MHRPRPTAIEPAAASLRGAGSRYAGARSTGSSGRPAPSAGAAGSTSGFSRVATVIGRARRERQPEPRARPAGRRDERGRRGANGRTWPPASRSVQTGSAAGVAMPSWAFLAKPAQASSKPAYIRQAARSSPRQEVGHVAAPRGTGGRAGCRRAGGAGSRRGRRPPGRRRVSASIIWPQAAPRPGSRDRRMKPIGR